MTDLRVDYQLLDQVYASLGAECLAAAGDRFAYCARAAECNCTWWRHHGRARECQARSGN
jgi:hypothetical protein